MVEELAADSTTLESIQTDFETGLADALISVNMAALESDNAIQQLLTETTEATKVIYYSLPRASFSLHPEH